jgi:hypothetical protein
MFCQIEYTIPFQSGVKVYRVQQRHIVAGRVNLLYIQGNMGTLRIQILKDINADNIWQ